MFGFGKQTRTITIDEHGNVIDDAIVKAPPVKQKSKQSFASFFWGSHKPYNDNGREYNPKTGNWEYTKAANGDANPCDMTETMKNLFPRGDEQYDGT